MLSERWQCLLVPKSISTLGWTLKNHAWGGGGTVGPQPGGQDTFAPVTTGCLLPGLLVTLAHNPWLSSLLQIQPSAANDLL